MKSIDISKNTFKYLLFVTVFIAFSVYLIVNVRSRFDTTHLTTDMQEESADIAPGETREFVYIPEAPFVNLKLRLHGQSGTLFHLLMTDEKGDVIIDGDFDSSDDGIDTRYGSRVLVILDSSERYTGKNYKVVITNSDTEESLSVLTLSYDTNRLSMVSEDQSSSGKSVAAVCLCLILAYVLVTSFLTKKEIAPEKFYLISAVFLSVIYLIAYLPQDCPDSESHFPAVYRWSNVLLGYTGEAQWNIRYSDFNLMNEFVNRTSISPASYDKYLFGLGTAADDHMICGFADQSRMTFYSVISYLPQVLGFTFGRILGLNGYACLILARLFMSASFTAGCLFAINKTPAYKKELTFVSLLPFSILLSGALSYDGIVLVLALMLVACVFKTTSEFSAKTLIELSIITFLLGGAKAGAGLILLPLIFIGCSKKDVFKRIIPVVTGIISVVLFDLILPTGSFFQMGGDERMLGASYAFKHPLLYLKMMISTYISNFGDILTSKFFYRQNHFVIDSMPSGLLELILSGGNKNLKVIMYSLSTLIFAIAFCLILFLSKTDLKENKLKKTDLTIITVALMLYYILTPIMLLSATLVGSGVISGVQGRYYLIVLVPEVMLLKNVFGKHLDKHFLSDIMLYGLCSVFSAMAAIFGLCINLI